MVIGPFINASAVLLGGVLGALLSQRLPERIRVSMTSIFGLASLGIGILLVVKCANLPAMVLATLLGALIGEICLLEKGVNTAVTKAQNLFRHSRKKPAHESFIQNYVAIIVLFCASGTGIFGAMNEGMTGDPSILIAKSFLDFFTAMIFACGRDDPGVCRPRPPAAGVHQHSGQRHQIFCPRRPHHGQAVGRGIQGLCGDPGSGSGHPAGRSGKRQDSSIFL